MMVDIVFRWLDDIHPNAAGPFFAWGIENS